MAHHQHIDIEYTAKLARISLTDTERRRFAEQLDSILGYVEKLEELNTSDVPPTAHPHPMENVWQEDAVSSSLTVEDALRNAPAARNSMFVVPKVVD